MKKCFKCGAEKPLSEFYKHKQMADGHLNKCKECTKRDVKENRDNKLDYYRSYDSWRFQNDSRVKERNDIYRETEYGVSSIRRSQAKWINSNREARYAHGVVARAVRSGKINKPKICPTCGEFTPSQKMHAHHEDYSMPLSIEWMCFKCHKKHHNPQDSTFTPIRKRGRLDT